MAAELKEKLGVEPTLIKGSGGAFEVKLNGDLIFSKFRQGRFPQPGEIEELVAVKISANWAERIILD